MGVFSAKDVAEGTIISEFNPAFDRIIRKDEITILPEHVQKWFYRHAWQDTDGHLRICIDNDKYTNHSSTPNTKFLKELYGWVAVRDIKKGEELTDDYTEYSESNYAKSLKNDDAYNPEDDI
jgi:SET domain-containing protein